MPKKGGKVREECTTFSPGTAIERVASKKHFRREKE